MGDRCRERRLWVETTELQVDQLMRAFLREKAGDVRSKLVYSAKTAAARDRAVERLLSAGVVYAIKRLAPSSLMSD